MTLRRITAIIAALIMLLTFTMPIAGAEMLNVIVRSAPLERSDEAINGMVRVYLSSIANPTSLDVTVSGSYSISGAYSLALDDGDAANVTFNTSTGEITLSVDGQSWNMGSEMAFRRHQTSGESSLKIAQARRPSNMYPGDLQLIARPNGSSYKLYPIVHVYIESYLYGVVPYEMSASWPIEALKAQAVAARTYTLNRMNSRKSAIYDVVDTTSDQVYYGQTGSVNNATRAVDETRGIVSMNDGKLSGTYYTASNGGQTESVKNAWGTSGYDYLGVKDDPFDLLNPSSNKRKLTIWKDFDNSAQSSALATLLTTAVESQYGANAVIDEINAVTPHTPKYIAPSRLYTKMDFNLSVLNNGAMEDVTLTFSIFDDLEAPLSMSINSNKNELWSVSEEADHFVVTAMRYGHGIGMSQRGAQQMAGMGYTYDQILGFYYTDCVRMQHVFTQSILPPVGGGDAPVVSTQAPADIQPGSTSQARVHLVNLSESLTMRYTPDENGKVITTIPNGSSVEVLAKAEPWTLIRAGLINGYVPTSCLIFTGTPAESTTESATDITKWGVITGTNSLNLRSGPSYDHEVISSMPKDAILCILGTEGSWVRVQYGMQDGYCASSYLTMHTSYPGSISSNSRSAVVTLPDEAGSAPIRASASTTDTVIKTVPHGTEVTVLSNDGTWCRVSVSGVEGYMLASALDFGASGVKPTDPPMDDDDMYAIVNSTASTLNLRESATTSSEILAEIPKGTKIIVTTYGSEWCAVRWGDLTGFVMTKYLSFDVTATPTPSLTASPTPEQTATPSPTATAAPGGTVVPSGTSAVTNTAAVMHAEPDSNSAAAAQLPVGTQVTITAYGSVWCMVTCNGASGWIQTSALTIGATVTPTPTPTPEPTATPTPEPTATAVPQPTPTATLPATEIFTEEKPGTQQETVAWVSNAVNEVNLRVQPSDQADILAVIPAASRVVLIENGETWSKISVNGLTGYVYTRYILDAEPAESIGVRYINTETDPLALRDKPSTQSTVLLRMDRGSKVQLLSEHGDWSRVQYGTKIGYCAARYLSISKPETHTTDDTAIYDITLTEVDGWEAIITTEDESSIYLHKWCSTESPAGQEIQYDTRVTLLKKGDIWCQISYEGEDGYCLTSKLKLIEPTK